MWFFPLEKINLVIDGSDKYACPCSEADYYNPARRGMSYCNLINSSCNINNVIDYNHHVIVVIGGAIPLQAVE